NPEFLDAMERLTNSAENYDARAELDKITAPTLIVSADEDYLTPIPNQKYLHAHIKDSEYILIPGAGHAAMYEKPLLFTTLILGFVNALDTKYNI
ncbi:MAG: alpha/beta hydrolase, partial [Acholeplasmataceae bacterium]